MAMTASEKAEFETLKTQFAQFIAGTVAVDSLTNTQKREVVDGILVEGFQLNYTDPIVKVGDRVWGKDATETLFGGDNFIATIKTVPVGAWSESDFEDIFRY